MPGLVVTPVKHKQMDALRVDCSRLESCNNPCSSGGVAMIHIVEVVDAARSGDTSALVASLSHRGNMCVSEATTAASGLVDLCTAFSRVETLR